MNRKCQGLKEANAIKAIGKSTMTRALCLLFQRQGDGLKDNEISLQKDWEMITIIINTEEFSVKEVQNEKIPIAEITEMVSKKRDTRDRMKIQIRNYFKQLLS